jgi:hypothetical protein
MLNVFDSPRILASLTVLGLALAPLACGKGNANQKDDLPADQQPQGEPQQTPPPVAEDAFSLTVPVAQRAASQFCGTVTPTIPEDPTPYYRFETDFLNGKLQGDGLTGWIHGAVPQYEQYVFTYRKEDPNDFMAFFKAEQFSLVPATQAIADQLKTLNRHDKVRLKGEVFENHSPLTHIMITSLDLLEAYPKSTDNPYGFDLAQLQGRTAFEVFGQVHATVESERYGRAIVIEHEDFLLPLAVPSSLNEQVAPLYRGDIVNVAVKVVTHEQGPPHFVIDDSVATPLTVVDPLINCHGLPRTVTGYLAKFEKSPAISTDVYAVRIVDANGIGRNFTLFPDSDDDAQFMQIFQGLAAKAKAAWDASTETPTVVRNYWKKESVKVTVSGTLNVVSTEQANAQVYIKSVDDLTITVP